MNQDHELLTRVRRSLSGATLSTPLETTIRRGRKLRARRRMAAALSATAVLALVTALTVTRLGNGSTLAPHELTAWTVTQQPHGLVVVRVLQLRDPAGLQRELRAHGIPAAVNFQRGALSLTPPLPRQCRDTGLSPKAGTELQEKILGPTPPPAGGVVDGRSAAALTIRPAAIPEGIGLNLTVQWANNSWGWSLGLVRASPQCTGA